jgi:streptomycin 6-kinase
LLSASHPDEGVGVIIGLVRELAVPVTEPIRSLADESAHWIESLQGDNPVEPDLVDTAVGLLRELAPTQGPQVLLHQDLHADNVVAAEREPWLAIDPKPLVGELEFAVAPLVRGAELGHSRADVRHRLERSCDELGLDRERARGWTVAQTVAWGYDDDHAFAGSMQTVRWLLD